jgi:hypothetical protein
MTQESFVGDQNHQTDVVSSDQSSTSVPAQSVSQTTEKMIPQSQVNEIVKSATARVADKYRNESVQKQSEHPSSSGLTEEEVRRIATETSKRQHEESLQAYRQDVLNNQARTIAEQFRGKMEAAKGKYEDFDQITQPTVSGNYGTVILFLNSLENGADVLYDLSKNPEKLEKIEEMLKKDRSGELASRTLKSWSSSIKINEQAKNAKVPNEPLRQIQPSPTSTDDGSYTLRDLRKADWLRG